MSIEKPANERLELYNRFKQSLKEGADDDRFYDADDLIIIHDQAVDLDDQYVQIETLMRGFRYFPENEELATRRGFLYYDLNLDNGVNDMLENHTDNSPMWDLLKVRLRETDEAAAADIRAALDRLLQHPDRFDDETVIQLVDAASAAGCYSWLKENEKALRKKTEYLPSLLYELFIVSDLNGDRPYGMKLLEELTEIEPFNLDFWLALAQTQLQELDPEGALASCDYAMAIASDDVNVLSTKATALGLLGRFEEVIELVDPVLAADPTSILAESKVRALIGMNRPELMQEAFDILYRLTHLYPENRALTGLALEVNMPGIEKALLRHYDACSEADRDDWFEWARRLYVSGHPAEAADLLEVLRRKGKLDFAGMKFLASALYTGGRFEECATHFLETLGESPKDVSPDLAVAGLLSLLRLKRKSECKKALKVLLDMFPLNIKSDWMISSTLETIGFSSFIGMLNTMLKGNGNVDLDVLDIFHLPSNYNDETLI